MNNVWWGDDDDVAQDAVGYEPEATNSVRGKATACIVIGAVVCVFSRPLGVLLMVLGVLLWLFSPVLEVAEITAYEEASAQVSEGTGTGCGAVVWACFIAAVVTVGAAVFASYVGLALLHGGL